MPTLSSPRAADNHVSRLAPIPMDTPFEIGGFTLHTQSMPAMNADVGGDYYDVFGVEGGRFAVLIGDIVGKGLRAASGVARVQHAVRIYSHIEQRPSKILELTNNSLSSNGDFDYAILSTAFLAIINPAQRTITYANAGHPRPILYSACGKIAELTPPDGLMLGIEKGYAYEDRTQALSAGDTIVMFTDGITEARRYPANPFEVTGIIDLLAGQQANHPSKLASSLFAAAASHAGGELEDDAAIVVLRMTAV